ncbi:YxlC family protein [Metabacillus malikii]|uniref:Flp pilus assembly protein TadB n=1 Tax=Metabacillus malikii TaxID=1504265 RepID=A0ABT9ZJW7_9BACI|nr:YxlC family protein [Metabacillus malikii]MDQ0232585.1 Flp pilus assembly protein TadB [Metabacillus malikii]
MKDDHSTKREQVLDTDEQTVKQIVDGLDKIYQWNTVSTPDLQWFQQNVELQQKRIRRRQWKDLITFISVAAIVLSVVIAIVYRQPILFLYFQLVGIILLPISIIKTRKRVGNE